MKIAGNKKKSKNLETVESSTLEEKKNNKFSSKFLNKKSGITMVALVVTIVVLLILASISIQGITRTGIFRAAEDTKLEHKRAAIATTLQTKLKINQTEQIRGTDEEIVKATYEDVKNDLEEIKKAGGKDIEVSEVTSEEKDGKTEWFFEVKVDGDVYKVGLDGSDYLGKEDELAPLIEIKKATATTNTITATVTTRRNEGGKIEYYIKEKGSQKFDLAGTTDQNTFKYTKLKQEKTYVIEAVAINTNGKKKVSKEYEIKTSLVPKIDSNEIKFASVPNEWTNKSVEVTATLTVDGQNFTLTTSKNSTSGWIASNRQIFTENGTMYAALTDGNNYGIAASHEVTNIDTTKPIVKSLSVTTNTIKITATDEASGIYSYAISESETMPKTFTKLDNSTQVFNTVVENLKQSTKYYVWVKDVAGNISEVASTKTGTVPKLTDANTTITKSPNDWTTQEVTATVTTTEKNYALQTKKDNGEWQTTNSQKYTENGTIYARLWDGTNAGEEIYKPITNIDKTAPTATNIEIKNVTPAGYDVYVYGVKDNGSGVNRVQFPTWTEAKGQDDIQPNWQTGASSKGTKQADGTTWVYHVNITDHKTEAGEYNTHIYAYDNLENGKCIGTQKVTIPMVKITYDENYVKDGTTNKQTVEKVYNTELGKLGTPTRTGYTFAGWFTEATGGTQISSTTKTPVTDTTYYAHWNANPLNFANQTISKTFSTSEQKANITGASNGTGNYTYTEKTEKNSAQKDTNYISINGTTITIAANTPADTYTYVIVATDNNSKVTKEATYTIKIERAKTANAGASDKTYNGANQTGVTGTSVTWTGTTSAIDAGTYTANATPDANHAWSDGTTNAKTITWKMNPKSIAVTWGTTTTFTYNGQQQAPTVSATSGITGETINVTRTTGTNAGSYTSTASISSVTGGRARKENYTLTGNTKAFTINKATVATPTNLAISTAGIVTWSSASNATSYQISIDDQNWTNATSGVDYLSTIIGTTGNRTVYVRAINSNANNYTTPSDKASKTVAVYTTTINSNSTNMGTVDTSSYNVISGASFTTSGNKLTIKGITSGTTTKDLKVVTATNKTGYSFSKWSVASGTITTATTITATFTANTYTVAYNGNGATGGSTANTTATYDQSAAIATNGFTRTGYTFAGWTTKADGTNDGYGWTNWKGTWKYVDGQYGIANRKLQLYARWTPNKYTISYNGNGATGGSTANTTATYDQNVTIASNGYTRTGYTFAGWTTKTNGTDDGYGWTNWKGIWKYVDGQYGIASGKLQLYAIWTANQLNFANQTINKTFSTGTQTAGITGASNGTGSYTYTEKTEKNASGTATNYISISGTTINIAASTPAGTYTYVITAKDNNSGVTKDATYTINVARAKNASASASNKTYNGKSQTGVTGSGITWSGTTSGIDAGTYTATATPDGNHAWSDGTTGAKTITWTMNKKTVAVTWGTTTTFNYNGNAQAPTASATSGVTGETINVTRTTGRNAGSYTSTASISSVTGGRAKIGNYALSGNTKAFTINKVNATMTNPALATGLVYNTKAQSLLSKAGSASGGTIKYGLGANSTTAPTSWNTSVTGTNAGTYFIWTKVDADGNHNGVAAKYIGMVTIAKATVTIPGSPVKAYTYTGSAISHGYTAPTGSAIETGTTGSATDAGTYNIVLKITNTSNYQWNDKTTANKTVNWKINPKSVAVTWGTTTTFNYTGRVQAPTASATSGITGETINVTRTSAINAGTYTSKASISSVTGGRAKAGNYTLTGNTKSFTINKVAATNPTLTSVSAKYDKNAHEITVSGGSGGTIYYRTSTDNSSWGSWSTTKPSRTAIGTTYVQAYVAGDGNHTNTSATGSATITITKPTAADVSYTPSDSSWKVENVKQALDALYNR
ncbi:listeria/Bacterioides repeat protein [Clostridium sp. CAG:470]|nr:listeria/Bacterioides repeat protein [Clostridium sp. CAG:470]